ETPGRGAEVEADAAARVELEGVERGFEFQAAARDVGAAAGELDVGVVGRGRAGLGRGPTVDEHEPGRDGGVGLGAGLEEASLDQDLAQAPLSHGGSVEMIE